MDRHAKKREKKRKARDAAKKQARIVQAERPSERELLLKRAARDPWGPCWLSDRWDDLTSPLLVTAVVTRKLPNGLFLPGIALVDRTCLGVKDSFMVEAMASQDLDAFVARVGEGVGGMVASDQAAVQSVVFHAIDYAQRLGFEPHRDFPEPLFGPRPDELVSTPFHDVPKPLYFSGPDDNVPAIVAQLTRAVGPGNFEYQVAGGAPDEFEDEEDEADEAWLEGGQHELAGGVSDEGSLVKSPLECSVTRDGITVDICIYRGEDETSWILEIVDQNQGSTVWDDRFATDQAALDEAMLAIEEEGLKSFVVPSTDASRIATPG